ncbi:9513_t:CDS:1, partial [Acaulospora colombiana]
PIANRKKIVDIQNGKHVSYGSVEIGSWTRVDSLQVPVVATHELDTVILTSAIVEDVQPSFKRGLENGCLGLLPFHPLWVSNSVDLHR